MTDLEKLFQLKKRWDSDEDDIGEEVFSPCLKLAKFYRAQTGFLSESVLNQWAPAVYSLVKREDVKIELLSSPKISNYMTDLLRTTLSEEDKTTKLPTQDIINTIDQIDPNDEKLDHICFSQINEPLLDNRFFEIAEYAKKSGFKIDKFFKGSLL